MIPAYLLCAALIAWPWSKGAKATLHEARAATGPSEVVVAPVLVPESPTAPDNYQGHLHEYHQYLNTTALIERADQMRLLNRQAKSKLADLRAGEVRGIKLSSDQMRQRVVELNAIYYQMVAISFATINDIIHADAYYMADVDPPFVCPPESGSYPGE
jgi:hypothetical protein